MNRVVISVAVVVAAVVGVMFNTQQVLTAQAVIVKDAGECGMFFETEEGTIVGGLGEITQVLENADKITIKCKGTGLDNATGRGQHFDGFECGVLSPEGGIHLAEESHATVSASGNGTLVCTVYK
jgi:hypothetical protein